MQRSLTLGIGALIGAGWMLAAATAVGAGNETLDLEASESATAVGAADPLAQQTPAEAATIDGFRSASFGMTSDQVRAAIESDFGLADNQITAGDNPLEKTTNLQVSISDLLPHGGNAQVIYIFGFESETLIQVNIIWGAGEEPTPADGVRNAASILVEYFRGQGHDPEKTLVGVPLEGGGLLAYYSEDSDGSSVTLTLAPRPVADDSAAEGDQPLLMQLSYVANAADPDVFRLEPGSF